MAPGLEACIKRTRNQRPASNICFSKTMNYINFAIEDRVGRIAFTEPPLNIFNIAMMKEINGALNECMGRHELVAIVFEAGPGSRAFSAGVSIEERGEE